MQIPSMNFSKWILYYMNICVYMSVCVFVRNAPKSDVMSNFSAAQKIKREQFYEIEKNRVVRSHKMVFFNQWFIVARSDISCLHHTLYAVNFFSFPARSHAMNLNRDKIPSLSVIKWNKNFIKFNIDNGCLLYLLFNLLLYLFFLKIMCGFFHNHSFNSIQSNKP